jgi:hypothetical protein
MPWTPWRSTSSAIRKASTIDHLQQPVVRDDDERVDLLAQLPDPALGLIGALAALEPERPGDDADGERSQLACDLGDDRRRAGAGAAALARRDEHHVRALQRLLQLVAALGGGLEPDRRVCAGAEPARDLRADVDLDVGVAHEQRLGVRVDRDELDPPQPGVDHAVHGVRSPAAHTDDLDHREIVAARISHLPIP